jgi:hypothetical protein
VDSGRRRETPTTGVPWAPPVGGAKETAARNSGRSGLGWKRTTRQQEGRDSEKGILQHYGAKAHPNSGAGSIPFDGSTGEAVIEVKDAAKTFRLDLTYLKRLRREAARSGKQGVLVVKFPGMLVECRILPPRKISE